MLHIIPPEVSFGVICKNELGTYNRRTSKIIMSTANLSGGKSQEPFS